MSTNVGISDAGRERAVRVLREQLSDTYALYFRTQSFHWNVRGPHFASLHASFESQYDALAEGVDELAERIRALGALAPTSLVDLVKPSELSADLGAPGWRGMVESLRDGHERLARAARVNAAIVDEAGDNVTADLLTERGDFHEKTAWMLRATLEE